LIAEAYGGRQRGSISWLPSGSARVKVYAGIDQLTGDKLWLQICPGAGHAQGCAATTDQMPRSSARTELPVVDHQLGLLASLVGLRPRQRQDQPRS
jgi:hypothetical protein